MVSRFTGLLALLILAVAPALGAEKLSVEPDRKNLYENETLTLTVTGEMELSINFEMLFSLGSMELPGPDIEKLEEDFDILARNQKYNVRTVNGETRAEITWTYQLAPRKPGQFTIPPLSFNDARSEPVDITVRSGSAPATTSTPRDAFIELEADKDSVYVQEQMRLTVRLFFSGNLVRGELSEPEHSDAIVESLGKQKEFNRFVDGQRYRVVQRQYAIYPQTPGDLALEPIRFEGRIRNNQGQLRFLRDSARLFAVPVKDIPDGFTGNTWLPASELTLAETGVPDQARIDVGESLTRTLTIQATGLQGAALPPLPMDTPDGLKNYPEQPKVETRVSDDTVTGTLTQTSAIVGVEPGTVTLPAASLTWWDTEADQERVARIPPRTLTVVGTSAGATTPSAVQPPDSENEPPAGTTTPADSATESVADDGGAGFWPWLTAFMALGWGMTVVLLRRQAHHAESNERKPDIRNQREQALFDALVRSAERGEVTTLELLPQWASLRCPSRNFSTLSAVLQWAKQPGLKTGIDQLQARHFGSPASAGQDEWNGRPLAEELQALRKRLAGSPHSDSLPPLYPPSLRAGPA